MLYFHQLHWTRLDRLDLIRYFSHQTVAGSSLCAGKLPIPWRKSLAGKLCKQTQCGGRKNAEYSEPVREKAVPVGDEGEGMVTAAYWRPGAARGASHPGPVPQTSLEAHMGF